MKKITAIIIAILALTIMLAACKGSDAPAGDAAPGTSAAPGGDAAQPAAGSGNSLTVGTLDSADGFDPTTNANCGLGLPLVYDTVLIADYRTGEIKPHLASSFGFTDDLTFVMEIRDDVYFSNGEKMQPSDVIYSLSRFVFENTQFETGFENIDYDASTISGNTITLKLYETDPDLVYYLSNDRWASVVCESYVKSTGAEAFWDAPVGTGAYNCTENVAGSHSSYVRKDSYWGAMPQAGTITVRYYSELTTMMVDFENKVLDVVLDVGAMEYDNANGGAYADAVTQQMPTYDILSVAMPQYIDAFNDIRVRQAIAMGLDVEGITQAVFGSLGTVADSCMIKGIAFYTPTRVNEYNPERAKELLAEAGFGPGDLEFLMLFPGMPSNVMAGTIVQSQLGEIGVTLQVETGDFATIIPRLMANECELGLYGTGGGTSSPSRLLILLSATGTNGMVRNADPEFNAYITEARTSIDPAARAAAFNNAQRWCADNYWYIPVAYPMGALIHHSNVDNLIGTTIRGVNFNYVTFN